MVSSPPRPAAAPPAQWLSDALVQSRVFDALQLSPYLSEFRSGRGANDAPALAKFLIEAGLLSKYQAERSLAGEAGKLLLGPYLLVEPIGSGSLGTVYQAIGRSDRKRYAVKVLPLRSLWNVHVAKQQVQVFAGLPAHPAVVPFVDVDSSAGNHYLAWPFVLGKTLAEIVQANGPRPTDQAVRIAAQVAEGLLLCHTHQVSHGLLKPSNILIGNDGQARILDLGIGAILSENIADNESMLDTISTANAALSMLDYAAPETLNSPTLRTPAGDIYSFGCTLYFLLSGGMPFPEGNAVDKVLAHQTETPRSIRKINPTVPPWLETLTFAMMAKNEADRPGTADVLAALLDGNYSVPNPQDSELVKPPEERKEEVRTTSTPWLLQMSPRASAETLKAHETPVNEKTDDSLSLEGTKATSEPTDPLPDSIPNLPPPARVPLFNDPIPNKYRLKSAADDDYISSPDMPSPVQYTPGREEAERFGVTIPAVEIPPLPAFARSPLQRFWKKIAFWKPHADVVQLSVFGPPTISPGDNVSLQVFAHTPDAFESVRTLSKVFHQNGELLATGFIQKEVTHNQHIGLHLGVVNAGVDRSEVDLVWRGQPQPRKFDLYVPWESPAGPSPTVLSAGLDRVLSGRIAFTLQILPRKA